MFLKVLDTPQSVWVWGLPMSVVHSMSLVQGLDKGDLLQYPIVHPFSKQWRKHCPGIIVWLSVWKFGSQPSRDRMTSTPLILGTKVACWPQYLASGARFATQLIVWRVCRRSAKKNAKTRSKWYKSTKIRNWVGSSTGQEMKSSFLETQQLQS